MLSRTSFIARLLAASIHFAISLLVAALVALLVFLVWYPGQFRSMSGGLGLFGLLVGVDVVLGPLLTFVAFNRVKCLKDLRRDLAVIAALQLSALIYGVHTAYAVRPVAVVYEKDRFRVVAADSVRRDELPSAPLELRELPVFGPWTLTTRQPSSPQEVSEAIFIALRGHDIGQRPSFWRPYDNAAATAAYENARPVDSLLDRYPARAARFKEVIKEANVNLDQARFVPVMARGDWVAILDRDGRICTYIAVDGFF